MAAARAAVAKASRWSSLRDLALTVASTAAGLVVGAGTADNDATDESYKPGAEVARHTCRRSIGRNHDAVIRIVGEALRRQVYSILPLETRYHVGSRTLGRVGESVNSS